MDYKEVLKEIEELREKVLVCMKLERDRLVDKAREGDFETQKNVLYICSLVGNVSIEQIRSSTRVKDVVHIRQIYCYLMLSNTRMSLSEIGKTVGRNHATVIHMRNLIKQEIKSYYKNGYDPRGTVDLLKAIREVSELQY